MSFGKYEERVFSRCVKVLSFDTKPLAVNLLPVLKISRYLNRGEKNYLSRVTETVNMRDTARASRVSQGSNEAMIDAFLFFRHNSNTTTSGDYFPPAKNCIY